MQKTKNKRRVLVAPEKMRDPQYTTTEARKELRTPENQRLMRQFMKNPEGERNSAAYREGWERTFGKK